MRLLRILEPVAVAVAASCLTFFLSGIRKKRKGGSTKQNDLMSAYLQAIDEIKQGPGPKDVLNGGWSPLVLPAPPPSMDVDKLKDGETSSYSDGRGAIYRFKAIDAAGMDDEFAAWYYTPYRSIIEQNQPLAQTSGLDLSIDLKSVLVKVEAAQSA
eukprot:gene1755-33166_t